jgi:sulfite exporter TauE/SafE
MDASLFAIGAAFAGGLAASLHCAAMCGPLACALRVKPAEYHLGRLCSYTAAGALAGLGGSAVVEVFHRNTAPILPWALAVVLIVLAFGLEKRLPQPRAISTLLLRVRLNRSLGWLTPLLPCGPLWLMLGAAAVTGTWHGGALIMAAFVTGTIPLPWLLQMQAGRLQQQLSPMLIRWTQQGIALVSAALLIWRAALPLHASCH